MQSSSRTCPCPSSCPRRSLPSSRPRQKTCAPVVPCRKEYWPRGRIFSFGVWGWNQHCSCVGHGGMLQTPGCAAVHDKAQSPDCIPIQTSTQRCPSPPHDQTTTPPFTQRCLPSPHHERSLTAPVRPTLPPHLTPPSTWRCSRLTPIAYLPVCRGWAGRVAPQAPHLLLLHLNALQPPAAGRAWGRARTNYLRQADSRHRRKQSTCYLDCPFQPCVPFRNLVQTESAAAACSRLSPPHACCRTSDQGCSDRLPPCMRHSKAASIHPCFPRLPLHATDTNAPAFPPLLPDSPSVYWTLTTPGNSLP